MKATMGETFSHYIMCDLLVFIGVKPNTTYYLQKCINRSKYKNILTQQATLIVFPAYIWHLGQEFTGISAIMGYKWHQKAAFIAIFFWKSR